MLSQKELKEQLQLFIARHNQTVASIYRKDAIISVLLNITNKWTNADIRKTAEFAQKNFIVNHSGEYKECASEMTVEKIIDEIRKTAALFNLDSVELAFEQGENTDAK